MPGGGYAIRGEGHRALREVERLTRNPEKLANAGGRCWKDTLGRKRSFKTYRPPYPTRRGLVTAWQETKKLLHDGLCQGRPEEEIIQKLPGLVKRPKNKQKGSLEESYESLIVGTADGREERKEERRRRRAFSSGQHFNYMPSCCRF